MKLRKSRKLSDETKRKMSQAKKGNKNPRYHVQVSETTREKISKSLKKYWETIPQ